MTWLCMGLKKIVGDMTKRSMNSFKEPGKGTVNSKPWQASDTHYRDKILCSHRTQGWCKTKPQKGQSNHTNATT